MPGVLELLPLEQAAFQKMVATVRRVYELHGFTPIETPVLELSQVLLTKTGGETERQVYFAQSTGSLEQGREPDLAMRFDLTVPLARYVAEHQNDLVFPFRRYQIQRVYRGEAPQRGRFREFYQADIDIIGRGALPVSADAECPAVIHDVFKELAIGSFTVKVNNRRLVQGLLADLDVAASDHAAVLREIDKLDKRGEEHVRGALAELGVTQEAIARLLDFVAYASDGIESAIVYLMALDTPNALMEQGRSELLTVFETLAGLGVDESAIVLDCSIARGLDYYTGTVFETVLDDHPGIGSICSGGRYDDLAGMYTNTALPGVGISIGLTRLFWQLREIGLVAAGDSPTKVFVTLFDEADRRHAGALATTLRTAGVPTMIADGPRKLGKQLRYADRAGIRFAIIAGSDERARGVVNVKDLVDQSQTEVAATDLPSFFQTRGSR
jgi:histidyl-tRNA synthetase